MREIKIKFWDKVLNCWSGGSHHLITAGKFTWTPETGNRYIPVEYTGLKDKNGTKGFEDDIGRHPDGSTFVVKWDKHHCGFRAIYTNGDNLMLSLQLSGRGGAEFIGNIHENPELIKEE